MDRSQQYRLDMDGKSVAISLGKAARDALQQRRQPVYVEMELYFSCMIRKQVRFYEEPVHSDFLPVTDHLQVGFRPVMTQQCSVHAQDGPPPVTDFPIVRGDRFIPDWLHIDFKNNRWHGEFGYHSKTGGSA